MNSETDVSGSHKEQTFETKFIEFLKQNLVKNDSDEQCKTCEKKKPSEWPSMAYMVAVKVSHI